MTNSKQGIWPGQKQSQKLLDSTLPRWAALILLQPCMNPMVRLHQGSSSLGTKGEAMAQLSQRDRSWHRLGCLWIRCVIIPAHPLWGWDEKGRPPHRLCPLHLGIPSSSPGFPTVSPYPTKPCLITKGHPAYPPNKNLIFAWPKPLPLLKKEKGRETFLLLLAGGY